MIPDQGRAQFKVTYELSPIILTGGIAQNVSGGMIPIISLTEGQNYDLGLLSSSDNVDLDEFFAYFRPAPGATLGDNQIAHYPFVNQTVAANAIITQPLRVSLIMSCPARAATGGYGRLLSTMTALRSSLAQHEAQGGLYNVITPAYLYTNCIRTNLREVGGGQGGGQTQDEWQWDFEQPLLTLSDAQAAQNTQMSRISAQTQTTSDPPTTNAGQTGVGVPQSGQAPSVVPAATPLGGASAAQQNSGALG